MWLVKYRLEHWHAVWERCVAIVDIPDDEEDPEEWAIEYVDDWIGDATCENKYRVESIDSEIYVEKVEGE